jgi:CheY-like chemotaxis protein
VEDNRAHAELVIRSLADHRVANRVYHVVDGAAALDYLYRHGIYSEPSTSPRPHVVLLDLRLPKVDGLEVLRGIRASQEFGTVPVVMLTTSEAERAVAAAYALHANGYVVKPLDFAKFTQLMGDLGFYWLGWNHYPWS